MNNEADQLTEQEEDEYTYTPIPRVKMLQGYKEDQVTEANFDKTMILKETLS